MGLITAALGGAGEGLEKGANLTGNLYLKGTIDAEHQRMLQEATAEREARNIALTGAQTRQTQAEARRIIPAGATEKGPNGETFQAPAAPEKALTPEQIDKLKAEAEELRARSRYYNRDQGKTPKETMPKLIATEKDDQGNPIQWLDQNTGAIGNRVSGSPAVPPVSHWFSANEPGKAAIPGGINWTDASGQPLPGLHVYYPDMVNRGVGEGSPGAPATAPRSANARPPLSDFFGGPKPAPTAATSGAVRPAPIAQLPVEKYLTRNNRTGGFMFQSPNRGGYPQLNGRSFRSPQEAQDALDALTQ